jgi:hypothetical protein
MVSQRVGLVYVEVEVKRRSWRWSLVDGHKQAVAVVDSPQKLEPTVEWLLHATCLTCRPPKQM